MKKNRVNFLCFPLATSYTLLCKAKIAVAEAHKRTLAREWGEWG